MKALIQRLVFVGAWIDKGCQIFLGIQAALLLILVTVQIALRQLDVSISWATELSCLLFIWMSLLGSAISSRYLLHIGVDVLKDRLKGKVKRAILFVSHFILLIGLIIFIFSSFGYHDAEDIFGVVLLLIAYLRSDYALLYDHSAA